MNILLTSVGRRTYMVEYFRQALHGEGLVFASNSILTYSLQQADKHVITPPIYDKQYIEFLLNFCISNEIKIIISLFDIDLPILSKNKTTFERNGITVIVSDEKVIKICNDKWLTYTFLKSIGVNCPQTYISIPDVKQYLKNGSIHFPLFIKPRWGMSSMSIYKVDNMEELNMLYKKIHHEIFNSYLSYESEQDEGSCVLIQETIQGQEYGLDILNDLEGKYVTTIAKQKLAMRAGETDIAEIVDNTNFIDFAQKISNSLNHVGNLDVDCFVTDKNEIVILEMNCRFGGQYPFSHIAGTNFPAQIITWIKGGKTNPDFLQATVGIKGCKDLKPVILQNEY